MTFDNELSGTRKILFAIVEGFPGIHFRDLMRKSNLSCGQVTHHVRQMKKKNIVETFLHGRNLRIFRNGFLEKEKIIISNLRNSNSRNLIINIMLKKRITHFDAVSILRVSPSTASWYLKKLENDGIVTSENKFFSILGSNEINRLLSSYRQSFADKVTSNFIESWEF